MCVWGVCMVYMCVPAWRNADNWPYLSLPYSFKSLEPASQPSRYSCPPNAIYITLWVQRCAVTPQFSCPYWECELKLLCLSRKSPIALGEYITVARKLGQGSEFSGLKHRLPFQKTNSLLFLHCCLVMQLALGHASHV